MDSNTQNLYLIPDHLKSRFGRVAIALIAGFFLALGFHLATGVSASAAEEDDNDTTTSVESETDESAPQTTPETENKKIDSPIRASVEEGTCILHDGGECDISEGSKQVMSTISEILSIFGLAIGIASLAMILYGSFRYVVSGGDEKGVKSARSTIIYAVVGLVLSLLSWAIVSFVLEKI